MGYHLAGFEVVGIDKVAQPRYPFEFVQADAMEYSLEGFDVIHASPPCQAYTSLTRLNRNADDHPKLIGALREKLNASGIPWVMENVKGAPLLEPVELCGTMFPGLRVFRHRLFEFSSQLAKPIVPAHGKHPLAYTTDRRKASYGKLDEMTAFVSVHGGGNCTADAARDAMGIPWMTKAELNEAIPPKFTEYIGACIMRVLVSR